MFVCVFGIIITFVLLMILTFILPNTEPFMDGVLSCRTDHAICEVGTRLRVYFGGTEILCNDMVAMETTKIEPLVIYSSAISNYRYVLLMIDPDAPFPCAPPGVTISDHIHYAAVVRSVDQRLTPVNVLIDYHSPHPSIGIHRYQIYLFDWHPGRELVLHNAPDNRALFNMDVFRSDNNLSGPLAVFQFRVTSN